MTRSTVPPVLVVREYRAGRALCMCGCGNPAAIATRTNPKRYKVEGQPCRFATGHYLGQRLADPAAAFWARVQKGSEDECWPFVGPCGPTGYGIVSPKPHGEQSAHRRAYVLAKGPIPKGLIVRHTCDNPPCCNPAHLLIGTHADNAKDREERGRGRQVRGSASCTSKLTEAQIPYVRELVDRHGPSEHIAQQFGVSLSTVKDIYYRRTWRHVPEVESTDEAAASSRECGAA